MCAQSLQSHLTHCNPVDCSHQAPLSMRFSRPGYWSRLPCTPPGDLPDPGREPVSPALQEDPLPTESPGKPPASHNETQNQNGPKGRSLFPPLVRALVEWCCFTALSPPVTLSHRGWPGGEIGKEEDVGSHAAHLLGHGSRELDGSPLLTP